MSSAAWGDADLFGSGKPLKERFGKFGAGKNYYENKPKSFRRGESSDEESLFSGSSPKLFSTPSSSSLSKSSFNIEKKTIEEMTDRITIDDLEPEASEILKRHGVTELFPVQ